MALLTEGPTANHRTSVKNDVLATRPTDTSNCSIVTEERLPTPSIDVLFSESTPPDIGFCSTFSYANPYGVEQEGKRSDALASILRTKREHDHTAFAAFDFDYCALVCKLLSAEQPSR
jgi:hypothetical protein